MNRRIRVSLIAMLIAGLFLVNTNSAFGQRIKVNFTIKPPGVQISELFPMNAPLHAVKVIVLAYCGSCSPSEADDYHVMNMNGETLDESKSLLDNGVQDNDRLIMTK